MPRVLQDLEVRRNEAMFYKLIECEESSDKFFVPNKFFSQAQFINMDSVTISVGGKKQNVEVILCPELDDSELKISKNILEQLSIPTDINYQAVVEKNAIKLGPVIGLLMVSYKSKLTKGVLKQLEDYCVIYKEINGLLVAFSVEGIDFDNKLVKGYYYSSASGDKAAEWKAGVFPFPDSIFQRINLSEDVRLKLKYETENRMFNSNYFNKWEFWNMVSKYAPFLDCIPDTRLLESIDDIDYMISKYEGAYLKPINGTLSRGLYRVTNHNGVYGFQGKTGSDIANIGSKADAEVYLNNIIRNRRYLIQQAIRPLKVEERHLDFRVIMQKDHTRIWSCTGIIGFVGGRGDICTNWGFTSTFENTLKKHFNFTQEVMFRKKQEIISYCKNVCEMLDFRGGNYGDLGFDVMIDEKLKVWILEVNKRHYHSTPLWINDTQTYYEVKSKPIKYAAALAGFTVY
jgi:hypothetical protein